MNTTNTDNSKNSNKGIITLLLMTLFVSAVGCSTPSNSSAVSNVVPRLNPNLSIRHTASASHGGFEVQGVKLAKYMKQHRAVLFGATSLKVVRAKVGQNGEPLVYFSATASAQDRQSVKFGAVTPITADGYFLTANHNFNESMEYSLIMAENGNASIKSIRIVWQNPETDMALIKADIKTSNFYRWAQEKQPAQEPVMVASTKGHPTRGNLITRIPNLENASDSSYEILHDSLVIGGDSGSPLVNLRGELLGVNVASLTWKTKTNPEGIMISKAVRPSVNQIQTLVNDDRSQTPQTEMTIRLASFQSDLDDLNNIADIDVQLVSGVKSLR